MYILLTCSTSMTTLARHNDRNGAFTTPHTLLFVTVYYSCLTCTKFTGTRQPYRSMLQLNYQFSLKRCNRYYKMYKNFIIIIMCNKMAGYSTQALCWCSRMSGLMNQASILQIYWLKQNVHNYFTAMTYEV